MIQEIELNGVKVKVEITPEMARKVLEYPKFTIDVSNINTKEAIETIELAQKALFLFMVLGFVLVLVMSI